MKSTREILDMHIGHFLNPFIIIHNTINRRSLKSRSFFTFSQSEDITSVFESIYLYYHDLCQRFSAEFMKLQFSRHQLHLLLKMF